jgi:hypothetical protein
MMFKVAIISIAVLFAAMAGRPSAGPHRSAAAIKHERHGRVQSVTDVLPCANCIQ